jgi:hypothetical protein
MAKKLKVLNAILCDYVGQGANNKHMLVNAIAGNVYVQSVPVDVGFGLYIEFELGDSRPEKLFFEVTLDGERLMHGEGILATLGIDAPASFVVPRFEFLLEKQTVFEVFIDVEGFQRTTAIRKTIGPIPSSPTS